MNFLTKLVVFCIVAWAIVMYGTTTGSVGSAKSAMQVSQLMDEAAALFLMLIVVELGILIETVAQKKGK